MDYNIILIFNLFPCGVINLFHFLFSFLFLSIFIVMVLLFVMFSCFSSFSVGGPKRSSPSDTMNGHRRLSNGMQKPAVDTVMSVENEDDEDDEDDDDDDDDVADYPDDGQVRL